MINKPTRNKNREFLDWIARKPCCSCRSPGVYHESTGEYLNTPSHIKSRGAGGHDERNTIPQCFECHGKLHRWGVNLFIQVVGVDLHRVAREMWKKWENLKSQNSSMNTSQKGDSIAGETDKVSPGQAEVP